MSRPEKEPARRGGRPRLVLILLSSTVELSGCWESPTEPVGVTGVEPAFALVGPTVSIDAGFNHTCAIGSDGLVACWGSTRILQRRAGGRQDRRVRPPES